MDKLPLYLLLVILPLGVAGQNIGGGVAALLLLAGLYRRRRELPFRALWAEHKLALLSSVALVVMQVISTHLNPANPDPRSYDTIGGHLIWILVPPLVYLVTSPLTERDWQRLFLTAVGVCVVLAAVALSQAFFGWRLAAAEVERGFQRAQGLYSHPMSFAYVCLVILPLAAAAAARWPRRVAAWVMLGAVLVAIAASRSRTVEVVTAGVLCFNLARATRGRLRLAIFAVLAVGGSVVFFTRNPLSERFHQTMEGHDTHADYPDDRFVFWQVNAHMVAERPLVGHGEGLNKAYRAPYYAALGYGDFPRQYEAHNMFLQEAVNVGAIGLACFLAWLWAYYLTARRASRINVAAFAGTVSLQILAAWGLGGLTQNAFQDSTVRYALTVAVAALWLTVRGEGTAAGSLSSSHPVSG